MNKSTFEFSPTKWALLQGRLSRFIRNKANDTLEKFDLKTADWIVLGYIEHKEDPQIPTNIAHDMGIPTSYSTMIISKLEKAGYLTVKGDTQDERRKIVSITKKGCNLLDQINTEVHEQFLPYFKGISDTELNAYLEVIKRILQNSEK